MENRLLHSMCFLLAISDFVIINGMFFLTVYVMSSTSGEATSLFNNNKQILINVNLMWLLSTNVVHLYNKKNTKNINEMVRPLSKSLFIQLALGFCSLIVLNLVEILTMLFLVFYSFCMLGLLISRFFYILLKPVILRQYPKTNPVAVIGLNQMGYRLADFFEGNKDMYTFRGFLDTNETQFSGQKNESSVTISAQLKHAAENNIREVYVTLAANQWGQATFLLKEAERYCVKLNLVPDFSQSLTSPFKIKYMGEFPIISHRIEPLESINNRFHKRLIDVLFSLLIIIFLLSWLLPIIALLIKLDSKGPVFFKQKRSGRDNKTFFCYKFRTMKVNSQSDTLQATRCDDRIFWVGSFLRKTSLDELPQFFNVLLGNMSVVGPRPHMLRHTQEYNAIIDRYMVRNYLKPGITGWAQVNGYRGETTKLILMEKRIDHDIWYLENWSLMLDLKIMFLTVIELLKIQKEAY